MFQKACSEAARQQGASQPASWLANGQTNPVLGQSHFPYSFSLQSGFPSHFRSEMSKKVKNQEFKKTRWFLEVLYFYFFDRFAPKVAWGATL